MHELRELFASLPPESDDQELDHLVRILADRVSTADRPRASLKAYMRHNAQALPPELRERIVDLVHQETGRRKSVRPMPDIQSPVGEWYTGPRAAGRLGLHWTTLKDKLRHYEHRRRYGYPHWTGHEWRFSSLAIEPATAVAFAASLPAHEPLEELLPVWCMREGHTRAPREALDETERAVLSRRAVATVG